MFLIVHYQKKISGPLLDRIDLHIEVPQVKFEKLSSNELSETSESVRSRVQKAREIQSRRFKNHYIQTNSEMRNQEIREFCRLDEPSVDLLKAAVNQLHLSARAYNRILKLSRTIADLANADSISIDHLAEALQFRAKTE
jgi:magnesium chelatase family protein